MAYKPQSLVRSALIASLAAFSPAAHAQAPASNLNLFRNYFVTGDYSAGGVGLRGKGAGGVANTTSPVD